MLKKIIYFFVIAIISTSAVSFVYADTIEFRVNMSIQALKGTFNPAEDKVFIRATFNAWGTTNPEDTLFDGDHDLIYTKTISLPAGDSIQFKFVFRDVSIDSAVWENINNRRYTIPSGGGIYQDYFDRDSGDVSYDGGITYNASGPEVLTKSEATESISSQTPCAGNNYSDTTLNNTWYMGNKLTAISWVPSVSSTIMRIEMFTGEKTNQIAYALWDDNGGKPGTNLGNTAYFTSNLSNSWQGGDLLTPVAVTAGTQYWVVFDPAGGEQAPIQDCAVGQGYWGSFTGTVTGGASWGGINATTPFSSSDHCWKFRMFCCISPPSGLVGWWTGDNNADDISGKNNDGALQGGATYATGKVSASFSLNSTSAYIEANHSNFLNFGTGDFSIDAWIKTTDTGGVHNIVEKRGKDILDNYQGYSFYIFNGKLGLQLADAVGAPTFSNYLANSGSVADGQWHLVGVTVDRDDSIRFFVDGARVAAANPIDRTGSLDNQQVLRIGHKSFQEAGGEFVGQIDEVEIFNRELTPLEVYEIWDNGSFGKCKGDIICTAAIDLVQELNIEVCQNVSGCLNLTPENFLAPPSAKQWTQGIVRVIGNGDPVLLSATLPTQLSLNGNNIPVTFATNSGGTNSTGETEPNNLLYFDPNTTNSFSLGDCETLYVYLGMIACLPGLVPPGTYTGVAQLNSGNGANYDLPLSIMIADCDTCISPPNNMVAWWPGDNNTYELLGISNMGTLQGGATYSAGKVDDAFFLNTINDYVTVPTSSSLNFGTSQNFSIDAWILTTQTSDRVAILDKRTGDNTNPVGYVFFINYDGNLGFQLADGLPFTNHVTTGQTINDGNWHHVAVTIDRSIADGGKLYIDGDLKMTFDPTTHPGNISTTADL
ncbi:MAG: hypothetical protein EPO24_15015, partial [Bacteroidetes bacterium]